MKLTILDENNKTLCFHMDCYRKFVNLSKKQWEIFEKESVDESPSPRPLSEGKKLLHSTVTTASSSSSAGVFDNVCFTCEKSRDLEQSIMNIVWTLDDQKLITKLID